MREEVQLGSGGKCHKAVNTSRAAAGRAVIRSSRLGRRSAIAYPGAATNGRDLATSEQPPEHLVVGRAPPGTHPGSKAPCAAEAICRRRHPRRGVTSSASAPPWYVNVSKTMPTHMVG